jgi:hypothetical protein
MGNSAGVAMLASSTLPAGASIASGMGSIFETGATGTTDKRFPHRIRAMFEPSVKTGSPAAIVIGFLIQKTLLPMR